jgi:hypothetical protein
MRIIQKIKHPCSSKKFILSVRLNRKLSILLYYILISKRVKVLKVRAYRYKLMFNIEKDIFHKIIKWTKINIFWEYFM